jgi:hypothetical protein
VSFARFSMCVARGLPKLFAYIEKRNLYCVFPLAISIFILFCFCLHVGGLLCILET